MAASISEHHEVCPGYGTGTDGVSRRMDGGGKWQVTVIYKPETNTNVVQCLMLTLNGICKAGQQNGAYAYGEARCPHTQVKEFSSSRSTPIYPHPAPKPNHN